MPDFYLASYSTVSEFGHFDRFFQFKVSKWEKSVNHIRTSHIDMKIWVRGYFDTTLDRFRQPPY